MLTSVLNGQRVAFGPRSIGWLRRHGWLPRRSVGHAFRGRGCLRLFRRPALFGSPRRRFSVGFRHLLRPQSLRPQRERSLHPRPRNLRRLARFITRNVDGRRNLRRNDSGHEAQRLHEPWQTKEQDICLVWLCRISPYNNV